MQKDTPKRELENALTQALEVAFPVEAACLWGLKKVFGPSLDVIGENIAKFIKINLDQFLKSYEEKKKTSQNREQVNFRVASSVLRNAIYTNEQASREYLSGALASSHSKDGADDSMIYYLDIINSLSSRQLRLHYLIYRALNELNAENTGNVLNLLQENDMQKSTLYINGTDLSQYQIDIGRDCTAILSKDLIKRWESKPRTINISKSQILGMPVVDMKIVPSSLGFQLYGVACNRFSDWRTSNTQLFDKLPDIETLRNKSLNKSYVAELERHLKAQRDNT